MSGVREQALQSFANRARKAAGLKGQVQVLITSSDELRAFNRRFRRKDKPTDVLSFPAIIDGEAGDIAISADIASENAFRLGHSLDEELRILILHGILHLAGHDHENDRGEMEALESDLRERLQLPSSLIERTNSHPKKRAKQAKQ
ncbi:MAG TPA: rRNA maturation RNase YbeY [Candidatus Koribacter sp.]